MEDYYLISWTDDNGNSHTLRFNSPGNSSAIALCEALKNSSKVKKGDYILEYSGPLSSVGCGKLVSGGIGMK